MCSLTKGTLYPFTWISFWLPLSPPLQPACQLCLAHDPLHSRTWPSYAAGKSAAARRSTNPSCLHQEYLSGHPQGMNLAKSAPTPPHAASFEGYEVVSQRRTVFYEPRTMHAYFWNLWQSFCNFLHHIPVNCTTILHFLRGLKQHNKLGITSILLAPLNN